MALQLSLEHDSLYYSRAGIEDVIASNCNIGHKYKPIFKWHPRIRNCPGPLNISELFIGFSGSGSHFLQGFLESNNSCIVATIILPEYDMSTQTFAKSNGQICDIVSINGKNDCNILFAVTHCKIPTNRAIDWAEALLSQIQPEKVFVFDSIPDLLYSSSSNGKQRITLQVLTTSHWKQNPFPVDFLQPPRMAVCGNGGASAAVLTICELRKVPAALVATVYSDPGMTLLENIECFVKCAIPVIETLLLDHKKFSLGSSCSSMDDNLYV